METCTHPLVQRNFGLSEKAASFLQLLQRYIWRGGLTLALSGVRSTKQNKTEEKAQNSAALKTYHQTTEARRLRPPRGGVRPHKPHVLPQAHMLPVSRVCVHRPRTDLALSDVGRRQTSHRQNDRLEACTHPDMKRLFCLRAENGLNTISRSCI